MDFEAYDIDKSIYAVLEQINEKWYVKDIFVSYKKAIDWVFKVREWESRWKEMGFEYAPTPGIYKIVWFKEKFSFTIDDKEKHFKGG